MSGALLAVEAHEKEEARILAMRKRNEDRRERFLNARDRTIGVDVQSLNAQCQAKVDEKASHANDDSEAVARASYINMLVEQREQEEQALKQGELDNLKSYWDQQRERPKNECQKISDPLVPELCGAAALQLFDGEDRTKNARIRVQTQQMRSWSLQQQQEKVNVATEASAEEAKYAEYMSIVAEARREMQEKESAERKAATKDMQRRNIALADEVRVVRGQDTAHRKMLEESEVDKMANDPWLNETERAPGESDGRIQRDHFKGFSKEMTVQIYKDNEELLRQKAIDAHADDGADQLLIAQQEQLSLLVEQVELASNEDKGRAGADNLAQLRRQMEEQAELRAQEKANSRGAIDPKGLMGGFGQSWR